ncbi:MAG: hypothetical protein HYW07_08580 [Candidatus Latescibacteria bacterium]|nr:hypothetical protein [Candidatus Latescibacterota bacterium]
MKIFKAEQTFFHRLPQNPDLLSQFYEFISTYYADDLMVVHAHHGTDLYQGPRPKLVSGHPHAVIDLYQYINHNFTGEIEQFYELYHTMQWLSIREHNDRGLAVVGLVVEGVEKLKPTATLNERDPDYDPYYCHLGVWVMRKDPAPDSVWKTHFVLSGLPVGKFGPEYIRKVSSNDRKAYRKNWQNPAWWADRTPKKINFDYQSVDEQRGTLSPSTELLGWEVIIDGLSS